uniref:Large ribosomal subunit protein uL18c n=1 Tax=Scinaia undulata TaxID=1884664 RepID=A0A1G4NXS5_9FLOR|nr:Ribosomal protein L18 [Scinaia undulata]SCW23445.1 Ribosomal protein L18 [Scinaia undulata]
MKAKIKGTTTRPRLYIFRSNKHIYAQVIDDSQAKILISKSSISNDIQLANQLSATCGGATIIGKSIAEACLKKGITQVVFDKGKKLYHGRIKALADAARKEGINF